jgi:hypothetical protein
VGQLHGLISNPAGSTALDEERQQVSERRQPTKPARPAGSRSLSASASASLIRNPARQSKMMSARVRSPVLRSPAQRITATISSTVGGSAG